MKAEIKLSEVSQKSEQKCANPNCTCANCNCGSNCTCKNCGK
jgi:hypothetical protein